MWGHGSGRTMRVHWTLQEMGVDYDVRPIQARTGETLSEEYTALNPKQKIPTLQHDGFVLTESPAIAWYVADSFDPPAGFYAPRDPQGRARVNEWCSFVSMELDAHTLYIIRRHDALRDIYGHIPDAVASAKEYFLKQINAVTPRVQAAGPYLLGEDCSIADILFMTVLDWARLYGIDLPQPLVEYQLRIDQRPAYRRAFELNYEGVRTLEQVR